ncbi:MAG: phenylalanine--tRNA ligase subunit beta, partial [Clostridia bacterium]|nr:phenylalanine--tRNA ligase subunit beta [Clostridia bacterium]
LPSMLKVLADNNSVKNKGFKLFEMAKVYLPTAADQLPDEPARLTLGFYTDSQNGFYEMKGYIEAILDLAGVSGVSFKSCTTEPTFHPGRCAEIYVGDTKLGVFGEAHPAVAETYDIASKVYLAELAADAIYDNRRAEISYVSIPKHPAIERDFSFVCEEAVEAGAVADVIKSASKKVSSVELFDIYRGPQIGDGKKSMSYAVMLRAADRTLTDAEADEAVTAILDALREKLGITLR